MPRPKPLLATAAALGAAFAALAAWGFYGWPGSPNVCLADDACFCEAFRTGWIRQPANTWSNLGFVAVGLWLASRARTSRAGLFAAVIALLGPGSMALHASMTDRGGAVDVASMFLFIAFPLCHDVGELRPELARRFDLLFWPLTGAFIAMHAAAPERGPELFGALLAAFVAAESAILLRRSAPGRRLAWLAAAGGFFLAAFALWLPSKHSTGPLCAPHSLWQGHAAWHVLCALAAGSIYLYLEPELANGRGN